MTDDAPPPRKRLVRPPSGGSAEGRGMGARVKTSDQRSLSSQTWLRRQLNDPFVKAARAHGYRSRAAYKLIEIDERHHVLAKGARVVDLGCAPGGWLQVAMEKGAGRLVGVDILPVEPVTGADVFQGDFTDPLVVAETRARLGGGADVVLSDMAPNTLGHRQTDHLRIVLLIEAAAAFAMDVLRPGGVFVTKAFQGGETKEVLAVLKANFDTVKHVKPKASRGESAEVFLVAMGFRPADGAGL